MYRLPLFPLDVVLFPGAVLPLHIFEPRYRRMVARCLEYDRRFGLMYHDSDRFGPFLTEEGRVGALAEIKQFRGLPDGRSLILVQGMGRVVIDDGLETDEPYYEALVDELEDTALYGPEMVERRQTSIDLFTTALNALPKPPSTLPDIDPTSEVSFRFAPTVLMDHVWRQNLLEMRDERKRLDRLDSVFLGAIARYKSPRIDS